MGPNGLSRLTNPITRPVNPGKPLPEGDTDAMGGGGNEAMGGRKDFFVSHAGPDAAWSEWVAWQLVEAGYTVELDRWDWPVGANFVEAINNALAQCDRIMALFSAAYFDPSR
jgi:TIR domain